MGRQSLVRDVHSRCTNGPRGFINESNRKLVHTQAYAACGGGPGIVSRWPICGGLPGSVVLHMCFAILVMGVARARYLP